MIYLLTNGSDIWSGNGANPTYFHSLVDAQNKLKDLISRDAAKGFKLVLLEPYKEAVEDSFHHPTRPSPRG